jgi:RNA polymerase sigma-70 factor (ECF subfamily)
MTLEPSDESLFESYRDRSDEEALRVLVERHWPGAYKLAYAIVRDTQAAEDVAQDSLVRVVQAARARKRLDPFAGWLRTVTVNEARMSLRSRKRRERREEAAATRADPGPGALDPAAGIREYTESLEERLRLPLVLHYGLGLSHSEVGLALGCPAGTASSRIREGLEQVRSALAAKGTPVALGAIGASLVALGAAPVPAAPRVDALVARAAATKAVGVAAGKKLTLALAAFGLCAAVMGGLVVTRLGDGVERAPGRVASQVRRAPELGALDGRASGRAASPDAASVLSSEPAPAVAPLDAPGRPEDMTSARAPVRGWGATPVAAAATSGPETSHVKGRVVDAEGRGVPGARVALSAPEPGRGFQQGVQLTRRVAASGPPPAIDFKDVDASVQRAMAVSRTLRGLVELVATASGPDGSFDLEAALPAQGRLFVAATKETSDGTLFGEKPSPGDDAGDVVVSRLPAVFVAVSSGGAPVASASVTFLEAGGDQYTLSTDASGTARHPSAAPSLLVTAAVPGFTTARATVALAGADQTVPLELSPESTVVGTVSGPDGGPLGGVVVTAVEAEAEATLLLSPPPLAQATTGASGAFSLGGLAPGRSYELEAVPADETVQKGSIVLAAPASNASFQLGRAGAIVATIAMTPPSSDPRVSTWSGVVVERQEAGSWTPADADRSVNGNQVTFARLAPGTYHVASHGLLCPAATSDPVTIPADGGTLQVALDLVASRTITGRVVDASGVPIKNARIVRSVQGMAMGLIVGESGQFTLTGVSPDAVPFTIMAMGYADRPMAAGPGQDDLGDIVLLPAPEAPQGKTPAVR